MPRLAVDADVELSYTDTGTGRPVVFVHGGHMTHAVWRHQVAALAPEYRAITVDLRGHGDSDKPYGEYSVRTFAHDIATVFEELGLENGVVVGWSLGAQVVADLVERVVERCRLREVEVPALVVHGANDDVTSEAGAEYFATDVLDGRSVTFEHSEHFPFLAEPTAFNKTLREFLDEL